MTKVVPCLVCGRPCKTDVSRARRVGGRCWRKLRRQARANGHQDYLPLGGGWAITDLPAKGVSY